METRDYLSYIVNKIHTVIVATIDKMDFQLQQQ